MYTLRTFQRSRWSFVAVRDGRIIFRSTASDLRPLLRFIRTRGRVRGGLVVYDRIVGRAAALLLTLIRPHHLSACILSRRGRAVLGKAGIGVDALKVVDRIMDVATDSMCRWEKLSDGQSARSFLRLLQQK